MMFATLYLQLGFPETNISQLQSLQLLQKKKTNKLQDNFLQKLLESGEPEDLRTAAKLSSQGYRSYVWRQGATGRFGEDFWSLVWIRNQNTFSESGLEYDATQKWLPVPA